MEKNYSAFISYSRKDLDVARWLHTKLEKYPYPQDLTRPEYRPYHDKSFRPVFMDVKDLSPTEHPFNETITTAIERSRFLILICSAHSAKSEYVDKEVHYFQDARERLHQNRAVLPRRGQSRHHTALHPRHAGDGAPLPHLQHHPAA